MGGGGNKLSDRSPAHAHCIFFRAVENFSTIETDLSYVLLQVHAIKWFSCNTN